LGVGVVATNEFVSGGFKKGIRFDAKAKEKESRKFKIIHKRTSEREKDVF